MRERIPFMLPFGHRLRQARKALGLTQNEAAALLGVKENTYRGYENAYMRIPVELLPELERIFKRPVTYFLGTETTALSMEEATLVQIYRAVLSAEVRQLVQRMLAQQVAEERAVAMTARHGER